ncbi:MAG TPA: sugar-binding transcriptional regulator [Bauldia sp.]|nr:sugar-binding transcriptional regulator [Bauldia sp.]
MPRRPAPKNGKEQEEESRLDVAARAGWLYYIAGNTQDEIARKLNVSRPTAQRLVSLALSERLITFRLDHPIAACMELARRLAEKFDLLHCDVVPTDPTNKTAVSGVAGSLAGFLEQKLAAPSPIIIALGTGRTLRAAVDQIRPIKVPHHQLVSLVGNIAPDGSASFFDTLTRLADLTQARHYPIPLPLVAASQAERDLLLAIEPVRHVYALAARADLTVVGIGQMDMEAQAFVDGFLSKEQLLDLMRAGAAGEIIGRAYDVSGHPLRVGTNLRLTSVPLTATDGRLVVGAAAGPAKVSAIRAALAGRLISGLVTDEATAAALLASR